MRTKHMRVIAGLLVMVLTFGGAVCGARLGVGVSSEPLDIAGGGFFLDSDLDVPLLGLGSEMSVSLRPTFSLGPLPLNMQLFIFDVYAVLGLRFEGLGAYAGIGPGFVFTTDFDFSSWSVVAIAGLEDIRLTDRWRLYIQIKIRERFFVSPGFGLVFSW